MEFDLIERLQIFLDNFENMEEVKEIKSLTKVIQEDKDLMEKISRLQNMDKYNLDYIPLKKEILENSNYKRYITLTNDLNLLMMDFSLKLKDLVREDSSC